MNDEEETFGFQKELEKAKTLEFSSSGDMKMPEGTDWIEPTLEAKKYDLEQVTETIRVEGYELKEPPKPADDAEKKALERADPTSDYKRNREAYGVMCPICRDTKKCQTCRGRGRVKIFFRCRTCLGTGVCIDCGSEIDVHCPQCGMPISKFASTCTKCGLLMKCSVCGSPLPAMATKCMMCHAEFKCRMCGKPYPRQYTWRCPHCMHWNE